jgi:N-formylmaleamate deformylase
MSGMHHATLPAVFGSFCILSPAAVTTAQEAGSLLEHSHSPAIVCPKSEDSPARSFEIDVRGSGRSMILIPGLSCGGDVWKETVEHFETRYECHVLTIAGFAGCPAVDGPLLPQVRDDLIAYIEEEGLEQPILVGHSLGGLLSYWIAATAPRRVGPVIVVDGVPFYSALKDPHATAASAESLAVRRRNLIQKAGPLQQSIQTRIYLKGLITDHQHFQRLSAINLRSDSQTVGQGMYELLTTDLRPVVSEIQSPLLLIGAGGGCVDEEERTAMERRYRAQVSLIPRHEVVFATDARHFIQFDAPEFLWSQMESFLGRHDTGGGIRAEASAQSTPVTR